MPTETAYQNSLVSKIKKLFPGCHVQKNDPTQNQGIPDLLILFGEGLWAMLEVKRSAKAPEQPNQRHFVERFNRMSFAAFIYPENEKQVLDALQSTFGTKRKARLSKSK